MTTLLTAKFAQVDASILDIQTQINSLQTKLTTLAGLPPAVAISRASVGIGTIAKLTRHGGCCTTPDASQVGTFKDAIDIKFATEAIGILEPADTTAEPTTPEPITPTAPSAPTAPDVEPAIDVEAEVTDATVTAIADRASS